MKSDERLRIGKRWSELKHFQFLMGILPQPWQHQRLSTLEFGVLNNGILQFGVYVRPTLPGWQGLIAAQGESCDVSNFQWDCGVNQRNVRLSTNFWTPSSESGGDIWRSKRSSGFWDCWARHVIGFFCILGFYFFGMFVLCKTWIHTMRFLGFLLAVTEIRFVDEFEVAVSFSIMSFSSFHVSMMHLKMFLVG